MKKVILICGVSGAGKTWVCKQLTDKFTYVPHDESYDNIGRAIKLAAKTSDKPIITECPFAERVLKTQLENMGFEVTPYFVIEPPDIVAKRYMEREKKPIQKSAYSRASTIINRAREWGAFFGSSQEVLDHLKTQGV